VPVAPAQIGPFVNGVWTGEISVLQPGTNVVLRAQNDSGRIGNSAGFAVEPGTHTQRLTIMRLAQEVHLRFLTDAGIVYRVEASDSLTRPVWTQVGHIVGTGDEREFVDPTAANRAQRFYRVVAVP
jgi:hypothetical protein